MASEEDIIRRESGGNPYIGWGNTDLRNAPLDRFGFPIWPGKMGPAGMSHAAGLYQFQPGTWAAYAGPLGITDFSPESQRRVYQAARAKEGDRPWAASEPGAGGGRTSPEGYYGGAQHLTVQPIDESAMPPEIAGIFSRMLARADSTDTKEGGHDPGEFFFNRMLDNLMAPQQEQQTAAAQQQQPQMPALEPPQLPVNVLADAEPLVPPDIKTLAAPQPLTQIAGGMPPPGNSTQRDFYQGQQPPTVQPFGMSGERGDVGGSLDQMPIGTRAYDGYFNREAFAAPPHAPQTPPGQVGPSGPDIQGVPRRQFDYPRDDEYGTIPQQGPALTPLPGPAQQPQVAGAPDAGANLLNRLLGISSAQAAPQTQQPPSLAPPVAPQPSRLQPQAPPEVDAALDRLLGTRQQSGDGSELQAPVTEQSGFSRAALDLPGMQGADDWGQMVADNLAHTFGGDQKPITGQGGTGFAAAALDPQGLDRATGIALATSPGPIIRNAAKAISRDVQKIFSPTTVDSSAGAAEATIRQETGQARRATAQANATLEESRPLVAPYIPNFQQYLNADPAARAVMPEPLLLKFLDFVEGRSSGKAYVGPPDLEPLADTLRDLFKKRQMAIAAEPATSTVSFIEDYFPHLWKEGQKAASLARGSGTKQGSGANLRRREIPTIREGIERGLTPVSNDPIEMSMRYISNMDRYLATNRAFDIGQETGMIQYHSPGQQPEGWTKLEGRKSQVAVAEGMMKQAYAPDGYARVYNNFIDPGFHRWEMGGKIFDAVRTATNAVTFAKLGFSAYHAMAMAQEGAVSGLANGIGRLAQGDIAMGLKEAGLAGVPFAKATENVAKGDKFQKQYLGIADYGPDFEKIVDLGTRAGMRVVGRGSEYRGTAMDNYFKSWKRGALGQEMRNAAAGMASPRTVLGTIAQEYGRTMETISAPIFEGMIPRLKGGAFFDEMQTWLEKHPAAADTEQTAAARQIWDSIDNRFGEMVLDNVFWNKILKQSLQVLATSVGWELGTIREIGGGIADAARGQWSPRTRYVMALPVIIATSNAVYQYLKTGQAPEGAGDLVAPRTGGQTPEGMPERAILPGYEKDVIGYWHAPIGELAGKLSPGVRLGQELATGRDYFGHDLSLAPKLSPQWFADYAKHVLQGFTPIPFSQERYKGSNIGPAEGFFGPRPAPAYIQDPKRYDAMQLRQRIGQLKGEIRGEFSHAQRVADPKAKATAQRRLNEMTAEVQRLVKQFQKAYPGVSPP